MRTSSTDTSSVSPTAHYTGYVWYAHGLSHPALVTRRGRAFYQSGRLVNLASARLFGGVSIEAMLLQRHHILDHLLTSAIESGEIAQVIEVACGLSPRGWRFCQRYPHLTYLEGDLPQMSRLKHRLLSKNSMLTPNHHVVSLNALIDDGDESLAGVSSRFFDPKKPTAIITEGLIDYFDHRTVAVMWRRFTDALRLMSGGLYLSDIHLEKDRANIAIAGAFKYVLLKLTRGEPVTHFFDVDQLRSQLEKSRFDDVKIHRPVHFSEQLPIPRFKRPDVIRIVESRVSV